jgi:hypothetical protein
VENIKQAIAVLFQRKSKDSLTEKEFVFSASIDMRWFTPKAAQKLLDIALQLNLLSKTEGELRPNFDIEKVAVPLEFKPSEDILDVKVEDLLSKLVNRLVGAQHEKKKVVTMIGRLQEEYGIEPEVAALLLGNDFKVDLSEFFPLVEQALNDRMKNLD